MRSPVRLGLPADQFWRTPDRVATALGVRLHPTSGRQNTGVRATLPLA